METNLNWETSDSLQVFGIDPGIVHTGLVELSWDFHNQELRITARSVDGITEQSVIELRRCIQRRVWRKSNIIVEEYRPKSHFSSDTKMVEGQAMLKLHLPSAKIINNSGVKSIVTKELLQLLDLYDWSTTTHHNDLRSAARIALLAMLRDERANNRLAKFVEAALNNKAVIIVGGKKP